MDTAVPNETPGWLMDLPREVAQVLHRALRGQDETVVLRGDEALGQSGTAVVAQLLAANPGSLKVLRLTDMALRDGGSVPLFEQLACWDPANPPRLQVLDLTKTGIRGRGAAVLARVFAKNIALTDLDLSHNPIGDRGAEALAAALRPSDVAFCTLELLKLRRCQIRKRGIMALGQALRGNETVRVLNVAGNTIGDEGAQALAEALVGSTGLTSLTISDGKVGCIGISALATSLADNGSVNEFRASGNRCGDQAANPLGLTLRRQSTLVLLQLSGCGIGDEGLQSCSTAIGSSSSLEVVHLACNNIADLGVTTLARCLEDNLSLRELSLHDNVFGSKGFRALAATLLSNHTMVTLDLAGNDLSDAPAAEVFAAAIRGNESLMSIDLSRCRIGDVSAESLMNAIENNQYLAKLRIERNLLSKDHYAGFEFAMGRPRKPAGALLDQMEKARRQQRQAEAGTTRPAAAATAGVGLPAMPGEAWTSSADAGDRGQRAEQRDVDPVVSMMKPGQELSCPVALGRKDNIMTELLFTTDATLSFAREEIRRAVPSLGDTFGFVSLQGRLVPRDEEDKRSVLWDCGRHVQLRPDTWLTLEAE